jgi:hypothetical protein
VLGKAIVANRLQCHPSRASTSTNSRHLDGPEALAALSERTIPRAFILEEDGEWLAQVY